MNTAIYVFVGLLICKIVGYLTESLGAGRILGYMIAGIICGMLFGRQEYIGELSLIAYISVIFTVFYTGLTSEYKDLFRELRISSILSSLSVMLSMSLIATYLLTVNTSMSTALFIAIILSNTASEAIALMIDKIPPKLRTPSLSASLIDDLLVLVVSTIYISMYSDSTSLYINIVNICVGIIILIALFSIIILYVKHHSIPYIVLNKLFRYMARESKYFIDISLLSLLTLVSISLILDTTPLIYAYLSGIIISLGTLTRDPMLKYRLRIIEFSRFLSDLINAVFIPLFFLYIGLFINTSMLSPVLALNLVLLCIPGKLVVYSTYVVLRERDILTGVKIGFAMCSRGVLELALLIMGFKAGLLDVYYLNTLIFASLLLLVISISTVSLINLWEKRYQLGP
ncbi:MAG: cation:proton antiporter [Desulfurococcaceae archaeon]